MNLIFLNKKHKVFSIAGGFLSLTASFISFAANECGAVSSNGTVVCNGVANDAINGQSVSTLSGAYAASGVTAGTDAGDLSANITGISYLTPGASVVVSDVAINSSGASAGVLNNGASATQNSIIFHNSNVTTMNASEQGVFARNAGVGGGVSVLSTGASTITTQGNSAKGLYGDSSNGGDVSAIQEGLVNATPAYEAGGAIKPSNTITTNGSFAHAIWAINLGGGVGNALAEQRGHSLIEINGLGTTGIYARILSSGGGNAVARQADNGSIIGRADSVEGVYATNFGALGGNAVAEQTGNGVIDLEGETVIGIIADTGDNGNLLNVNGAATAVQSGSGSIKVSGAASGNTGVRGIYARTIGTGLANAAQTGAGRIETNGEHGHGIFARASGTGGSAVAEQTGGGTIITRGANSEGVYALQSGFPSTGSATVTVNNNSIETFGDNSEGAVAVIAGADGLGDLFAAVLGGARAEGSAQASFTGGSIITHGDGSAGLVAQLGAFTTGDATVVQSGGSIQTEGGILGTNFLQSSHGIVAANIGTGDVYVTQQSGSIRTTGDEAHGIFALAGNEADGGSTVVTQESNGSVQATGLGSDGITFGGLSRFFFPTSVTVNGSVSGGRLGGANGFTPPGPHGAGIHGGVGEFAATVAGTTITGVTFTPNAGPLNVNIGATGRLGALSDHAIFLDGGAATIINDGTITGYLTLYDENDLFTNKSSNSWNIRNFQATVDPLVRDTENVAVSDFGAGIDTFTNTATGTIRLLTVHDMTNFTADTTDNTAPTAWLTSGITEYFPDTANALQPSVMRSITTSGVEQTHLVNLESFENAGIITMADLETGGVRAVAGDVFVITANNAANGISGGGRYIANGGALHIDTVLNDGVIDDTDVLVIDGALLGSGGTIVRVTNALPGNGASTDTNGNGGFDVGEGILVVQSLEDTNADRNTFFLGGSVIDGAWRYVLDQTDGQSWYLHSLLAPNTPVIETAPLALQALNTINTITIGTRVGDRYLRDDVDMGCECSNTTPKQAGNCYQNDRPKKASSLTIDYCDPTRKQAWTRVESSHSHGVSESTTNSDYDIDQWTLRGGVDGMVYDNNEDTRLLAGINGFYGKAKLKANSRFGDGQTNTIGYGIGGALSWLYDSGYYADLRGQYGWYESDLSSDVLGKLGSNIDGTGYVLSAELGKRIAWKEGWTVTPQAQLSFSAIDFDTFTGSFGEDISLESADSLKLRLGMSVDHKRNWNDKNNPKKDFRFYTKASIIRELDGDTIVDVSGTKLTNEADDWEGRLEIGVERKFKGGKYSIFGNINSTASLENFGDSHSYGGYLGVKMAF